MFEETGPYAVEPAVGRLRTLPAGSSGILPGFTYMQLRRRALNDSPEKPAEALKRLRQSLREAKT